MLKDWYRVLAFPMDREQWGRLPRSSPYKYEYISGEAVISPRPRSCDVLLEFSELKPSKRAAAASVRAMEEGDWGIVAGLMAESFIKMPPFESLNAEERVAASRDSLEITRRGDDGALQTEACTVAWEPTDGGERIVGCALVTMRKGVSSEGEAMLPFLAWIFVSRWSERSGIGSALLSRVVEVLAKAGQTKLESCILIGNSASMMWHWSRGFQLLSRGW